jgi:hypothetical protein
VKVIYSKKIEGILDSSAAYPNPTSGSFEIAIQPIKKEVVIDLFFDFYIYFKQIISFRKWNCKSES